MQSIVVKVSLVIAAMGFHAAAPALAGTPENPEIADPGGDANGINGQGLVAGLEQGPDTRPASFDSADLRAVWFTTAYETRKIVDTTTGKIGRVEYVPTGLRVHLRTEGAIGERPVPIPLVNVFEWMRYRVSADLSGCPVGLDLTVVWATGGITPPLYGANLATLDDGCPEGVGSWSAGPTPPSISGTLATVEFSFSAEGVDTLVFDGQQIPDPSANLLAHRGGTNFSPDLVLDEAAPGRSFTVGSDVPADVECAEAPSHPDCQP